MDAETAARRWADTWARAWPRRRGRRNAVCRHGGVPLSGVLGAGPGHGWRQPLSQRTAPDEQNIECWFGQPIVFGGRASVEWLASWTEQGQELAYAGVTVLHFDGQGKVVEHRDYDNHIERREPPYSGW